MHIATPPAPCPPSTEHLALPFFDEAHRTLAEGLVLAAWIQVRGHGQKPLIPTLLVSLVANSASVCFGFLI